MKIRCYWLAVSAIADFTKAIELQPDYALSYLNRGVVYYYLSDRLLMNAQKLLENLQ
jgi:lipoprotein NlpI